MVLNGEMRLVDISMQEWASACSGELVLMIFCSLLYLCLIWGLARISFHILMAKSKHFGRSSSRYTDVSVFVTCPKWLLVIVFSTWSGSDVIVCQELAGTAIPSKTSCSHFTVKTCFFSHHLDIVSFSSSFFFPTWLTGMGLKSL